MTDAGRELLDNWLAAKYPRPVLLLRSKHRGLLRKAVYAGVCDEEIESLCLEGCCRAVTAFDPERGYLFETYCLHWMRSKVSRFVDRACVLGDRGIETLSGYSSQMPPWRNKDGDNLALFDRIEAKPAGCVDDYRRRVRAAIKSEICDRRTREILSLRFGLCGPQLTPAEIADTLICEIEDVESRLGRAMTGELKAVLDQISDELEISGIDPNSLRPTPHAINTPRRVRSKRGRRSE